MNKFKKEDKKKYDADREGLSPKGISALNKKEAHDAEMLQRAREIHARLFSDEYNFMFSDAFGEPQDCPEVIAVKNEYREKHNLPPLDENGQSGEFQGATMQHCIAIAIEEYSDPQYTSTYEKVIAVFDAARPPEKEYKNDNPHCVRSPTTPSEYDATVAEIKLRDSYRAVVHDSDPYDVITIFKSDKALFSCYVSSYKKVLKDIESRIEEYIDFVKQSA